MVTVNFKLTDTGTVQLDVSGPERFDNILQRCTTTSSVHLGGFIAVRDNRVLTEKDLVLDRDEIDVFPALSGG